jgi:hypothetical protein
MESHDCNFRDDIGMGCINDRCPLHRAMRHLASNLSAAAVLCRAFSLGHVRGVYRPTVNDSHHYIDEYERTVWRPGCGKQAP